MWRRHLLSLSEGIQISFKSIQLYFREKCWRYNNMISNDDKIKINIILEVHFYLPQISLLSFQISRQLRINTALHTNFLLMLHWKYRTWWEIVQTICPVPMFSNLVLMKNIINAMQLLPLKLLDPEVFYIQKVLRMRLELSNFLNDQFDILSTQQLF